MAQTNINSWVYPAVSAIAACVLSVVRYRSNHSNQNVSVTTDVLHQAEPLKTIDFAINFTDPVKRKEGICHVCRQLCEGWESVSDAHLTINQVSGGITNMLFNVSSGHGKSVLVRIFGENTEVLIDRESETKIFHLLSQSKFGPYLYGTFKNGRIEGFFDNAPCLEPPQMGERSPVDFPRLIAQELACMHSLKMPLDRNPQLWVTLDKWSKMAGKISFSTDKERARLLESINFPQAMRNMAWLRDVIPSPNNNNGKDLIAAVVHERGQHDPEARAMKLLFQSVFAHNDLLSGNLLHLKEKNSIQFIDFEYGQYNFVGFDIANHFCEYAGFDFNLERWYPDADGQKHFLKCYLEALVVSDPSFASIISPSGEQDDLPKLLDAMVTWVSRFALASHYFWGCWAIVQQVYSKTDFDYLGYAKLRFEGFTIHRHQFSNKGLLPVNAGVPATQSSDFVARVAS